MSTRKGKKSERPKVPRNGSFLPAKTRKAGPMKSKKAYVRKEQKGLPDES